MIAEQMPTVLDCLTYLAELAAGMVVLGVPLAIFIGGKVKR